MYGHTYGGVRKGRGGNQDQIKKKTDAANMEVGGGRVEICAALPWDTGCRNKAIERERESGKDQIVVEKGGGVYASGRNVSIFPFVWRADTPTPVHWVECSTSLWAVLLCRAAEGLIEAVRQRGKGGWGELTEADTVDSFLCPPPSHSQPATPGRQERSRGGEGASLKAKVRDRQGEGGEGRKEEKGGRKEALAWGGALDWHCFYHYQLTHTSASADSHPGCVLLSFGDPGPPSFFCFSSEQKDKRDRKKRRGRKNPLFSFYLDRSQGNYS